MINIINMKEELKLMFEKEQLIILKFFLMLFKMNIRKSNLVKYLKKIS